MTIAIIPARGGSKRLPHKNTLMFCGHPLIAYSINAAIAAPSIDHCFVTTDDAQIARIAKQYGAQVIERPSQLATDTASTSDAILHAVTAIEQQGIPCQKGIAIFQPTNPLRPVSLIEQGIKMFGSRPCDSLISVSSHKLKPGTVTNGYFKAQYTHGTASQEMPPTVYENGLLYISKKETMATFGNVAGQTVLGFETPAPYGEVDIDESIDFQIGECVYQVVKADLGY